MEKQNFQLLMERQFESLKGGERLLLHSCCGPCSSYVLDVLTKHFDVTLLYYNPNIYPAEEYQKRLGEQLRLIKEMPFEKSVSYMACEYDEGEFDRLIEVIRKKIPSYINKENGITKLKNYLIRQGYSYSQIKEALSLF